MLPSVPAPPEDHHPSGAVLYSRAFQGLRLDRFKGPRELLSLQITQNLHPKLRALCACDQELRSVLDSSEPAENMTINLSPYTA